MSYKTEKACQFNTMCSHSNVEIKSGSYGIMLPVTRYFPQFTVVDVRADDFVETSFAVLRLIRKVKHSLKIPMFAAGEIKLVSTLIKSTKVL